MRGCIAIMVACVGCTNVHTSTLPPYVRELRVAPDRIDMVQCGVTFTRTTRHNPFVGSTTERELGEDRCWQTSIPTVVSERPVPPPAVEARGSLVLRSTMKARPASDARPPADARPLANTRPAMDPRPTVDPRPLADARALGGTP
jgi:hypothetical protein